MDEVLERFFAEPNAAHYLRCRTEIQRQFDVRSAVEQLGRIQLMLERCDWHAARDALDGCLSQLALSPRVHRFGRSVAEACGEQDDVELFGFMQCACLEGLQATGQGTADSPFRPTYPTDARDLLDSLSLNVVAQQLVVQPCPSDVLTTDAGGALWFELSWMPSPSKVPAAAVLRN